MSHLDAYFHANSDNESATSASYGSPFDWFRKTINPGIRKKQTEQELQAARQKQVDDGNADVFDSAQPEPAAEQKPKDTSMIVKNKSDHVSAHVSNRLPTLKHVYSINTRQQTSRYLIGS